MYIEYLDDMLEIDYTDRKRLAFVEGHDREGLKAIFEAEKRGIIEAIFIGNLEKIKEALAEEGKDFKDYRLVESSSLEESAKIATTMVRENEADFIMKGLIDSSTLLKAVLDRDHGLRAGALLSHIMVYEIDSYGKLIGLTDGGMNIAPTVGQKSYIIENGVTTMKALGRKEVKVACLAAKESVDENMSATVDADNLKDMFAKNDIDALVDGPMALDLAISPKAKEVEAFESEVAGEADLLVVPSIEMGNGIGKAITYFAKGKSAGLVMGARVPIVLPSRADSHRDKLYSIALGAVIADYLKK